MERCGDRALFSARQGMVFDLICQSCGACSQVAWDPTGAISTTMCPDCNGPMSVIGIDFPAGRDRIGLTSLLEVIQRAGIKPVAVERHARGRFPAQA